MTHLPDLPDQSSALLVGEDPGEGTHLAEVPERAASNKVLGSPRGLGKVIAAMGNRQRGMARVTHPDVERFRARISYEPS